MDSDLAREIAPLVDLPAVKFAETQYGMWVKHLTARVGKFTERVASRDPLGIRLSEAVFETEAYTVRLTSRVNVLPTGQVLAGCILTLFFGESFLQITVAHNGALLRWQFRHTWEFGLRLFLTHYIGDVTHQQPEGEHELSAGSGEPGSHMQAFVDAAFPRPSARPPAPPTYILHPWCHDLLVEGEVLGIIRTTP